MRPGARPEASAVRPEAAGVPTVDDVAAAVAGYIYLGYRDEHQLQDLLETVLEPFARRAGVQVRREVDLGAAGRIDFVVGAVGVEVKVSGTPAAVGRQVRRYAASPQLAGVVLVTSQVTHLTVGHDTAGTPVRAVAILGGAF